MNDIIIVKNNEHIMISYKGHKLFIGTENESFISLKDKNIEQIKDWFMNSRKVVN